ncbi:MAG: sterol desaturase family protein [Gammaproteobacteria bacterium]|nr:sterol desaturase family protein [Gammaproteobacteria bacterium]
MEIILYSVPFFFLLIAVELIAERIKRTDYYRVNDSLTSLATGAINQIVNVSSRLIPFTFYTLVWHYFAIFELGQSWFVWVAAFVLYDFCYYWNHRMGHEMNLLWASHVVHHSSEEYNLTTALRQTGTGFFSFVFYLPMALLGFDPIIVITVGAINLVYQFWVHTRHVGKLGWYEWIFVTPSNHRAHHAQNSVYIDKNYGGVFILWDRMFGTYQEELDSDPVIFGITGAVKSWNPIWVNFQVYAQLFHDAWFARRWVDKLTIWFRRTGWRPADVAERFPLDKVNLSKFVKYDVPLPNLLKAYSIVQYAAIACLSLYFSTSVAELSPQIRLQLVVLVLMGLFGIGAVLEGKHYAGIFELIRNTLVLLFAIILPPNLTYFVGVLVLISLPLLFIGRVEHDKMLADVVVSKP